jgi:hypothetical protein
VGRDTETGALVRCDAYPPNWSASDGRVGVHALADAPIRDTAWLRPKNIRSQSLTNLTFFGGKVSATASAMLRSTGTSARNSEVGTPIGQATSG